MALEGHGPGTTPSEKPQDHHCLIQRQRIQRIIARTHCALLTLKHTLKKPILTCLKSKYVLQSMV